MKTNTKQLIVLITLFLIGTYLYALKESLFTPEGTQMLRTFHQQKDWQTLLVLLQNIPWGKTLISSVSQWMILLGILGVTIWKRLWLEKISEKFILTPRCYFLSAIFLLSSGLILAIFYYNYQFFPTSGDEHATLFQAKILAKGALTVPSPPLKEFFDSDWIINNGRMYAQYPIGTAIVMLLGQFLGMPWLIGPLFAALALIFIYYTACELYGELIARYGTAFLAISPLYLEFPPSYLSHAPQLFFMSVFIYCFIKTLRSEKVWYPLTAGMGLGMGLNIRPMTAISMSMPLLFWGGYLAIKDWRKYWQRILLFILGCLPFMLMLLLVNYIQNGNPLLFGHTVYNGPGRPMMGFSTPQYGLTQAITTLLFRYHLMFRLLIYPPISGGVMLFLIALSFKKFNRYNYLLWAFFIITCLAYLPAITNIWEYRYYYCASMYLLLLIPLGISNLGQWLKDKFQVASSASLLTAFLFVSLISTGFHYRNGIKPSAWLFAFRRPYDLAAQAKLNNAIVFIRSVEYFDPKWYARNSPDFNDPILYVQDLGERNKELMALYPGRKAYLYDNKQLRPL